MNFKPIVSIFFLLLALCHVRCAGAADAMENRPFDPTTWAPVTNQVRLGVCQRSDSLDFLLKLAADGSNTNRNVYLGMKSKSLSLKLRPIEEAKSQRSRNDSVLEDRSVDIVGKDVFRLRGKYRGAFAWWPQYPGIGDQIGRFVLRDHFKIEKPGKYELTIRLIVFSRDQDGGYVGWNLPPAVMKLDIRERDIRQ